MGFSQAERERRHRAMLGLMKENDFKALILMGDTNVGNGFYGDFRYYQDNRVIFYRQVVCIFAHSAPVLFASSIIQAGPQQSEVRSRTLEPVKTSRRTLRSSSKSGGSATAGSASTSNRCRLPGTST